MSGPLYAHISMSGCRDHISTAPVALLGLANWVQRCHLSNDASAAEGLEVMHHATILLPQLINSSFFSSIFFVIAAMILSFSFACATSLCFILCERQPLQSLQGEFNGFDAD